LEKVRQRALALLARREHSAKELISKLRVRGYDEISVLSVVEALAKEGLQSDRRFAEAYIFSRIEKGYGPVCIRQELRERGIQDDLINLHLDLRGPEWRQRAAQVREKRFGREFPANFRDKAKQMRFLQQRGFSAEQIGKIFKTDDE
jgi:regulatory protein